MKARCVYCNEMWNVSWKQIIPSTGYECPACYGERKTMFYSKLSKSDFSTKMSKSFQKKEPIKGAKHNSSNLNITNMKGEYNYGNKCKARHNRS